MSEEIRELNEEIREIEDYMNGEKETANIIDVLLSTDLSNFKVKSKKVEIPRLSEITGKEFVVELRVLPLNLEEDIEARYNKIDFDDEGSPELNIKSMEAKKNILVEAVYIDDKQIFKQSSLMKHFKAKTPPHLVEKLLTKGEITKLHNAYRELIGFKKDTVKDIKN